VKGGSGICGFSLVERWIALPIWITIFRRSLRALEQVSGKEEARKRVGTAGHLQPTCNRGPNSSAIHGMFLLLKVHRAGVSALLADRQHGAKASCFTLAGKARGEGDSEDNFLGAFCYMLRFHWRVRKMKRAGREPGTSKKLTAEEMVVVLFSDASQPLWDSKDPGPSGGIRWATGLV